MTSVQTVTNTCEQSWFLFICFLAGLVTVLPGMGQIVCKEAGVSQPSKATGRCWCLPGLGTAQWGLLCSLVPAAASPERPAGAPCSFQGTSVADNCQHALAGLRPDVKLTGDTDRLQLEFWS